MQVVDEQHQETTYAARAAAQDFSLESSPVAMPQHIVDTDKNPDDRNSQIYSYVTLVADRCHDARMTLVTQTNGTHEAVKV